MEDLFKVKFVKNFQCVKKIKTPEFCWNLD